MIQFHQDGNEAPPTLCYCWMVFGTCWCQRRFDIFHEIGAPCDWMWSDRLKEAFSSTLTSPGSSSNRPSVIMLGCSHWDLKNRRRNASACRGTQNPSSCLGGKTKIKFRDKYFHTLFMDKPVNGDSEHIQQRPHGSFCDMTRDDIVLCNQWGDFHSLVFIYTGFVFIRSFY